MSRHTIKWASGDGNIDLDYNGKGKENVLVSLGANSGRARSQSLSVKSSVGNIIKTVLIKQAGFKLLKTLSLPWATGTQTSVSASSFVVGNWVQPSDGSVVSNNYRASTDYISVTAGNRYNCSAYSSYAYAVFYRSNKTFLSSTQMTSTGQYVVPSDAYYVRFVQYASKDFSVTIYKAPYTYTVYSSNSGMIFGKKYRLTVSGYSGTFNLVCRGSGNAYQSTKTGIANGEVFTAQQYDGTTKYIEIQFITNSNTSSVSCSIYEEEKI